MSATQGVANRDLKLENLLMDQDNSGKRPLLKICDFGYSKHEMNSSAKSGVGTPIFMAPEIVFSGKRYNAKVGACHVSGSRRKGCTCSSHAKRMLKPEWYCLQRNVP